MGNLQPCATAPGQAGVRPGRRGSGGGGWGGQCAVSGDLSSELGRGPVGARTTAEGDELEFWETPRSDEGRQEGGEETTQLAGQTERDLRRSHCSGLASLSLPRRGPGGLAAGDSTGDVAVRARERTEPRT